MDQSVSDGDATNVAPAVSAIGSGETMTTMSSLGELLEQEEKAKTGPKLRGGESPKLSGRYAAGAAARTRTLGGATPLMFA